jgi:hypothetical protein
MGRWEESHMQVCVKLIMDVFHFRKGTDPSFVLEKERSSTPKYYNYSKPSVTAFIATRGVPSKITSNVKQDLQPTLIQPIMGPDNHLIAIRMANPPTKAPVFLCGPYSISSSGEPATVSSTQHNIVPLAPTKQPGVWSTCVSQDSALSTSLQATVGDDIKQQVPGLPIPVPAITTTTKTSSLVSSVPFEPVAARTDVKRKLTLIESLKPNPKAKRQSQDSGNTCTSRISDDELEKAQPDVPQGDIETRINSQQFPYAQKLVFKETTSGNPVKLEYEEGNYLACLAQMVGELPSIPIPETTESTTYISVSRARTLSEAETMSSTEVTEAEKTASEEVSGATDWLSRFMELSNSRAKDEKEIGEEDGEEGVRMMDGSSVAGEEVHRDIHCEQSTCGARKIFDVGNIHPCSACMNDQNRCENSQDNYTSSDDIDGLVVDVNEGEITESSQQDFCGSQGSSDLVVDV